MKIKRYVVFLSVFLLLFILGGGMPQIINAEEPESGTSYSTELKSLTIGTVKTSGKNYTDFNKYNKVAAMQTKYFYPELLDGENHIYYADVSTNTTNQYLIIAGERKSATATVQIRDLSDPNNLNEKKLEVDYAMGYTGAGVSATAAVVQPENPFITMGSGITPNQVLGSFLTVHYGMSCYEITVTDNNVSTIYYLILDDKGAGITPVAQGYDIDVDYEDVTFLNGSTKEKLSDELQYIKANGYAGISKSNALPNEVQSIRLTLNRDPVTTTYPYVESGTFLKEFYRQNSNYVSINGGEWSRVDGDGTGYSQELVLRQGVNIVQIRSRSDGEVRPSSGVASTINYSTRVVLLYRDGEDTYTKTAGEDASLKSPIELFRALAPNTTVPGEVFKKYDIYEENGKKYINLKTSDQYLCAKVLPTDTNAVISIDGSTQKVGGSYLIKLEPEVVNESNPLSISIIPANGNGEKEEVHDIYIKWEIGGANMETVDITNGTLDQTFSKTTYRYIVTPSGEQEMTFSFGISEGASISAVTKNGVELDVKKDVTDNKITVPADTQELIVTTTALTDGIPYTNTYYFEFPLKATGISDDTKNRAQALVTKSLANFNETYGNDLTQNSATYWPVFGYVACNGDLTGKTVFNVEEQSFGQATSWSAVILQLVMCGENPYNYHGINYVEGLLKEQDSQGSFGGWGNNIWALMALDAAGAQYNLRNELINIVSAQAASTTFDLDMRGWALIASSSHKDQAGVEAAIAVGVRGVKNNQIKEGDYSGVFKHPQYDNYNISTHSCVVSGLTATNLNINAELWTNSGKNPLTYLEREEFAGSISKDYLIAIGDIVNGNNVWQRQVLTRDKFNQLVNQAEKVIEATSNGLIKDNLTAKLFAAKEKAKNTDKNTVVGLGEVYYALKNALALADTTIKPDVTIGSDQIQANYVIGLINALPEGFSKDSAEAKNAKLAYYDLNEAQKNLVTNWEKLKDDTESEVDKAAAKVVTDQIADLGTITLEKEAAVTAARSAYNALTDVQKALVTNLDVLKAAEEAINELKPQTGTVTIDVERFTIGQGFYKEPVTMNFTKGETVFVLLSKLVGETNILGSSSYVTGIKGTDAGSDAVVIPDYIVSKLGGGDTATAKAYGNKQTDSALGSASYSDQGGWMFLVNNQSPTVGMGDYKVNNGDVIRIAFSYCGYGADLTGFEYGATEPKVVLGNRDELLKALSAVNTANRETLLANTAVKTAYDNAIAVAKDMTETTGNAQKAADALNQAIANMNTEDPEVKAVVDQISKLPTKENLTLADKDTVAKVSDAYKKLSDTQKSKVTNLETLTDAEAKIAELEAAAASEADQSAAKKVGDLIAGIKAADQLKAGDKAEIMKIRKAYQALTETQKGLISEETAGKLTAAEAAIGELEKAIAPVKSDTKGIEVIGLPEAVKKLVVDDKKDDATVKAAAKKAAEDANMAEVEVITLYGIKPEMTDEELAAFNADDTRYVTMTLLIPEDKRGAESYRIYHRKTNGDTEWIEPVLSEDGTCLIFRVTSFSDFGIMAKMKAAGETEDQKAAKAVDELIAALPTTASLALKDKSKVTEARAAYDKLTADQKALVTNIGSLTAVEAKLAELEKAASEADKAAAKKVTDQISGLPVAGSLALTDKTKVTEARAAYTALTDAQKTLVTNLATLTAAEAKVTELEKAEADKAAAKKVTDQITALGTITKWEQKAGVEAARSACNQLTVAQKALVTTDTLNLLKAAEAAVEKLKPTTGTITIDVERFTIGQGFFVEPVTVSIKEGEKAYEAIQGLVGSDNLIGDSNYLRAIKGADTGTATIPDYIVSKIGGANSASANAYGQKYTGSTLGEFDYSKYSGWMYLVNNVTPSVGINDYVLKDGDVLRFAFTYWGYGTDLTGLEFGTNKVLASIANKDSLLEAIAAVNANKAAYLSDADIKTAYTTAMSVVQDMTATQKATNDAATALNKAVNDSSGTDKAAAKTVMDKIAALPTVSKLILTDKAAVTAARSAYDALTATQKALVTNLTTLTAAEAKITELEKEAANTANKAAAKAVSDKIAALHSGTALLLGEKADVLAARIAYNALTDAQKALITNLSTLVAAEARIAELEKETPVAKDEKTGIEAVGLPTGIGIKVGNESADTDKTGEALKAAEKEGLKGAKIVSLYAIKPDLSDADLEKFNNDKSSYVTLTIPLSIEQQGYDSYKIYHKKTNGTVEWITPTLSADKKSVIFKVSAFSEFGVVGTKAATTTGSVNCTYQTQIENVGWQELKSNGAISGTEGKGLRLEGIKINVAAEGKDLGVEYQTHVQNLGWQGFKSNGTMSGTEGKALRIEGIQIRLTGKDAAKYDIYYRVHAQNYGWLDWAKNGESAGTEGFGYRLEGIEIKVVEKNAAAPGETEQPFITGNIHINYQTQIQNVGWQELKKDGAMSGTSGQSLRLEGIKINVENAGYDVGVSYQTHVENIGWQDLRTSGKMSGTEGESKRLEGIRISLTGNDADLCDVYYQVHAQNYGWLNWAKNGESAGTEGFGYRLEGIHIIVVPKGQAAPTLEAGTLSQAFISNN